MKKINSTRFGEIEVEDNEILSFKSGIPGFPVEKEFVLLPHTEDSPFAFLQSVSNADLSFLVVDPFYSQPDYTFELDDAELEKMGINAENPPQIMAIVSLRDPLAESTMNLIAPLVVNRQTGEGRQIVLERTAYTTRHKLFVDSPKQGGE